MQNQTKEAYKVDRDHIAWSKQRTEIQTQWWYYHRYDISVVFLCGFPMSAEFRLVSQKSVPKGNDTKWVSQYQNKYEDICFVLEVSILKMH